MIFGIRISDFFVWWGSMRDIFLGPEILDGPYGTDGYARTHPHAYVRTHSVINRTLFICSVLAIPIVP